MAKGGRLSPAVKLFTLSRWAIVCNHLLIDLDSFQWQFSGGKLLGLGRENGEKKNIHTHTHTHTI